MKGVRHPQYEKSGSRKTYALLGPDRKPYDSATPGTLAGHRSARIYGRLTARRHEGRSPTAAM